MFVDLVRSISPEMLEMAEKLKISKLVAVGDSPDVVVSKNVGRNMNLFPMPITQLRHSEYKDLASKDIAMLFSLSEILIHKDVHSLEIVAKNIRLCRKHSVKVAIASMASGPFELRTEPELRSFFITLGMSTSQAKQGILTVGQMLSKK